MKQIKLHRYNNVPFLEKNLILGIPANGENSKVQTYKVITCKSLR
ncbi:hypothetical protein SAMN05421545_1768 [Pontibacter lucknowensis]|uniref:Uncharacterized protein n=1 Tax=Pontibacter lucknowensis TaxID=1077936 RepID=A0A1N6WUX6_9BACT|nr:hypothetical protein SAMN05421545_1768 [Pontibacter lucknowensis]